MKFDIYPYIGVGNIKLGMTPDEIKKIVGEKKSSFKRNEEDYFETDEFDSNGTNFFVSYGKDGKVDSIEFALPSEIYILNENLYGKSFEKIRKLLKKMDSELEDDGYSITSYKFGIGVYCPEADENEDACPESIIVFKENYYDV